MYQGHVARGEWSMNNRQISITNDSTYHSLSLDLSRWLPPSELHTVEDNFVVVTLSLTHPNSLIVLEPSTLVINLRNSSTMILSPPPTQPGNTPTQPPAPQPVAVTTVYIPCPQETNKIAPQNDGVMAMDGQSIAIGAVLAFMVILAVSIIIPVVVCLLIHRSRKRGFYDLQSRQV